jgi:hypothetical protein
MGRRYAADSSLMGAGSLDFHPCDRPPRSPKTAPAHSSTRPRAALSSGSSVAAFTLMAVRSPFGGRSAAQDIYRPAEH